MGDVASKYITPSSRNGGYDRAAFTEDLVDAARFLAWAEDDGAIFGCVTAGDAFKAVCRMLDVDPIKLRKIVLGEDQP